MDIKKLECQCCHEKVSYEDCCIMPPVKTEYNATILCPDGIMCMAEYLNEIDDKSDEAYDQ